MQRFETADGLAVTASRPESVAGYEGLVDAYLGFGRDVGPQMKALLAADPEMPMALCAQGYFAKLIGSEKASAKAVAVNESLQGLLAKTEVSERERRHAAALDAWSRGRLDRATDAWEAILIDDPLDAFALRLAHFTHFYSGDGRRMRDSIARVFPYWPEDHPRRGFVEGMFSFGLEEAGEYAEAERFGRSAVARNPADAWSVHSVAHVLEMQERCAEGVEWVNATEASWSTVNNFRFHIYWHRALYHLERGEIDAVLDLYDRHVASDIDSDFYLDVCNAASLLWRLELYGVDIDGRWDALAEAARRHLDDTNLIFVSLHYLMPLVAVGDWASADRMIQTIERWAAQDTTQSAICAQVGLPMAKALRALRDGHAAEAGRMLAEVRYAMDLIGGSKAQRDVFELLMLSALDQGGDPKLAAAYMAERTAKRPGSPWGWRGLAGALERLGRREQAAVARARAESTLV